MSDPTTYTTYNVNDPVKLYPQPVFKTLRAALMNTTALQTIARR